MYSRRVPADVAGPIGTRLVYRRVPLCRGGNLARRACSVTAEAARGVGYVGSADGSNCGAAFGAVHVRGGFGLVGFATGPSGTMEEVGLAPPNKAHEADEAGGGTREHPTQGAAAWARAGWERGPTASQLIAGVLRTRR